MHDIFNLKSYSSFEEFDIYQMYLNNYFSTKYLFINNLKLCVCLYGKVMFNM